MKSQKTLIIGAILLAVMAILAAACKGGGGDGTPSGNESPSVASSPVKTSTCANDTTDKFREVAAQLTYLIYCPTSLPKEYAAKSIRAKFPQNPFLEAIFEDSAGHRITLLQGKFESAWRAAVVSPFVEQSETVPYGNLAAAYYPAPPPIEGNPVASIVLSRSKDGVDHLISGIEVDPAVLKSIAAGMALLES